MGLLIQGRPYKWSSMKQYREYVKKHGVMQFLNVWSLFKDRSSDRFLWGDEIECIVLNVDHTGKKARIALRANEILDKLERNQEEAEEKEPGSAWNVTFHPEYGNFMVEVTPGTPYGGFTSDLRMVEPNMRLRRCLVQAQLDSDEIIVTMSNYPMLGVDDFCKPYYPPNGPVLKSSYVPDQIMSPHPRFAALSGNIRRRRGKRVNITMPLYKDIHTTTASAGNVAALDERPELRASDDDIHMDAMGFGMGCCCLQVTFQTRSIEEARHLYDQQAVISPLLLALSANTPVHRGRLADTDVRWDVISQAVDDRTDAEKGLPPREKSGSGDISGVPASPPASPRDEPALSAEAVASLELPPRAQDTGEHATVGRRHDPVSAADGTRTPYRLFKSRYSSVDCYISRDRHYRDRYNDLPFAFDGPTYDTLRGAGVDALLARHVASLFTRDPLVVFEGKVEVDDSRTTEHWESIQSTNWRSVRFKPPPLDGPVGWRVEFRTMEIQASDFENAAFTVFITLLSRAISFFDLNFYIPLSLVDKNFEIAHRNDAARKEMFYFRNRVRSCRRKPGTETPFLRPQTSESSNPDKFSLSGISENSDDVEEKKDAAGGKSTRGSVWEVEAASNYEPEPSSPSPTDSPTVSSPSSASSSFTLRPHDTPCPCANTDATAAFDAPSTALLSPARSDAPSTTTDADADSVSAADVVESAVADAEVEAACADEYELMSMRQVMCGKCYDADQRKCFPGLIPIVRAYLDVIACDADTRAVVNRYLAFLEARAKGNVLTGAQWLRALIHSHPAYRAARDSVVSHEVMYDVARVVDLLGKGVLYTCELTGGWDKDASVHTIDMDHPPESLPFRPSPCRPLCLSRVRLDCPLVRQLLETIAKHPHIEDTEVKTTEDVSTAATSACVAAAHAAAQEQEQKYAELPLADIALSLPGTASALSTLSAELQTPASSSRLACVLARSPSASHMLAGSTLTKSQADQQLLTPHGALMAGRIADYTSGQYPGSPVPAAVPVVATLARTPSLTVGIVTQAASLNGAATERVVGDVTCDARIAASPLTFSSSEEGKDAGSPGKYTCAGAALHECDGVIGVEVQRVFMNSNCHDDTCACREHPHDL